MHFTLKCTIKWFKGVRLYMQKGLACYQALSSAKGEIGLSSKGCNRPLTIYVSTQKGKPPLSTSLDFNGKFYDIKTQNLAHRAYWKLDHISKFKFPFCASEKIFKLKLNHVPGTTQKQSKS